jgi:hypothetical protein
MLICLEIIFAAKMSLDESLALARWKTEKFERDPQKIPTHQQYSAMDEQFC